MQSNENFISVIDLNDNEVLINVANIDTIAESQTRFGEDCVVIGFVSGETSYMKAKGTMQEIKKKLRIT